REREREFSRDTRVKATPGDRDGKRILRLDAAGFHTFVAQDTAGIIAHIQVIVNFYRLCHRFGARALQRLMVTSLARIASLACYRGAEARRSHTITLQIRCKRRSQ